MGKEHSAGRCAALPLVVHSSNLPTPKAEASACEAEALVCLFVVCELIDFASELASESGCASFTHDDERRWRLLRAVEELPDTEE